MNLAIQNTGATDSARLDVMNFLNEVAQNYPAAISFASGRPAEAFFDIQEWIARLPVFIQHFADQHQLSLDSAFNILAQYGRTNGIIGDLIARQLHLDENITCMQDQVLVTTGCQEAMSLCVMHLCSGPNDVVLARSPTYIGITGVADLNGIGILPFSSDTSGPIVDSLTDAVLKAQQNGKNPRVLYLVPDFDNPTGTVLDRASRLQLIEFCASNDIVILEDNPYGMFRFAGEKVPTMYSLDSKGCVIYLGTYSKTICPALRVGFCVVPDQLRPIRCSGAATIAALSKAKSFMTVNTSQIGQAIAGAILLTEDGSLRRLIAPAIGFYHANRDAMLEGLSASFKNYRDQVTWNSPEGGFFLTVRLPFAYGQEEAEVCAREYGVITMPLSFFALDDGYKEWVRLAFSNCTPDRIRQGVDRFSEFVKMRLAMKMA